MRGGCLVLLLIITGLWMGGQGAYTWVTNRKQTTLPAADFINSPPDAKWVKLEHARLDLLSMAYSSVLGAGPPNEVYIPVRGPGEADDQQIKVLLSSRDPRFTAFASKLQKPAKAEVKTEQQQISGLVEIMADVEKLNVADCDVEGLLQFGIESNDRQRRKLANLNMNLDPKFVVIAHNEKPSLGKSFLGFGVAFVGLLIAGFGRSKKSAPPPLPPLPTA